MNRIKNAVVIHGPGRSGTTLLSNILSLHKDFYWVSGYVNTYPQSPILSVFNYLQQIDRFEAFNRNYKKFPRPSEAYSFWNYYLNNFNADEQFSPEKNEIERVLKTINRIKTYSNGHRFITKITGTSRYKVLNSIFNNPTIIWIDRKPESVVMSFYKQRWWYKAKPEEFEKKSKQELIKEYCDKYKIIQKDKLRLKDFNFIQVYYEDMVTEPVEFFAKICEELNLDMYKSFEDKIKNWDIYKGSNNAYKKQLNTVEEAFLENELKDYSKLLGYN